MSADPRHRLGAVGEYAARLHMERLGYEIVDANYRTRGGELDLVARDALTLVFCEVKTRRVGPGRPFDALGPRKQKQVRRMASSWLAERPGRPHLPNLRFDAIGVTIDAQGRLAALEHLEGAF